MDPELEAFITQAMLEVERDLSLPNNSLVDETPLPKIREGVRLKTMEVQLDQNFMARVPDNLIKHSRGVSVKRGPDTCGWRMRMADADGKMRIEKCGQ